MATKSDFIVKAGLTVSNSLTVATNTVTVGTSAYFVANGNIGIGTSSPITKLTVQTAALTDAVRWTDNINSTGILSTASGLSTIWSTTALGFGTGGTYTERMRIDSSGNVGIGNTNPAAKLHVHSTTLPMIISSSSGTSAMLEFQDGAATTNKWRIGSGSGTTTDGNFFIYDLRQTATRMVVDTSGNMGIGVTPNAWSTVTALQMAGPSMWGSSSVGHWSINTYFDGTNYKYINTGAVTDYYQLSGAHVWRYAASGTAGANVSFSEAMRIDSSGNILIGSADAGNTLRYLDLQNANTGSSAGAIMRFITANTAGTGVTTVDIVKYKSGGFYINNNETNTAAFTGFNVGASERMRIDSSGGVRIGITSNIYNAASSEKLSVKNTVTGCAATFQTTDVAGGYPILYVTSSDTVTASQNAILFYRGGSSVGSIGTTASATTYNTSSDYRLKENVAPITTGLATISALKPVTYDWVSANEKGEGFIAHELQEHIPYAVTGEKDAVNPDGSIKPQGVDYSKIVVHLVAAIQELSAKVAALESK